LERKKPRLKSIWTTLPVEELTETEKEGFQILEGPTRIYLRVKEMAGRAKRNVIGIGTDRDIVLLDEFDVLQTLRNTTRKGASCKILRLGSVGANFSGMLKNFDVRVAQCDMPSPPHFVAVDSEEFLFFLNHGNVQRKSLCALWTNYKSLTETMTLFFSTQWTNAGRGGKVTISPLPGI
ncbi:MAG: hypothetical protein ACE5PO_04395, partial [Candidatus Bathyarchaeia archaeon]